MNLFILNSWTVCELRHCIELAKVDTVIKKAMDLYILHSMG